MLKSFTYISMILIEYFRKAKKLCWLASNKKIELDNGLIDVIQLQSLLLSDYQIDWKSLKSNKKNNWNINGWLSF